MSIQDTWEPTTPGRQQHLLEGGLQIHTNTAEGACKVPEGAWNVPPKPLEPSIFHSRCLSLPSRCFEFVVFHSRYLSPLEESEGACPEKCCLSKLPQVKKLHTRLIGSIGVATEGASLMGEGGGNRTVVSAQTQVTRSFALNRWLAVPLSRICPSSILF